MPESLRSRFERHGFNWFPAYRGSGARVTYIASDWTEVRIDESELAQIRAAVQQHGKVEREFAVELLNTEGLVHASFEKLLSIRRRD